MHTTARAGWRIHFNSDLSGDALLVADDPEGRADGQPRHEVAFPAELLIEFAARALENAAEDLDGDDTAEWLSRRADAMRKTGLLL